MLRVRELEGAESYAAFVAFHNLLMGVKMTPMYMTLDYQEFFEAVHAMDAKEKEKVIRQAAMLVRLDTNDELLPILFMCEDKNGVRLSRESIKKMSLKDIFEAVVKVCLEIGEIQITMVTESEKKNSQTDQ